MSSEAGTKVKYVAEISSVREVWLVGAADLAYWAERLKGQGLWPAEFDGRARLLISAIEARYMGVRFRELCISVFVRGEHADAGDEQIFLAQGVHSSRLFAWFERTLFSTPYEYCEIEVNAAVPAWVRLVERNEAVFRAEMTPDRSGELRSPIRCGDENWRAAIFLPSGKVFYAKMSGTMRTFAFTADDIFSVKRTPGRPALGWLIDSSFSGLEWAIRENGTHSRSKSVERR